MKADNRSTGRIWTILMMRIAVMFVCLCSPFGLTVHALPVLPSSIFVLGDSLSDTGNTAALVPGFAAFEAGYGANNRFTNGAVWHEYLAVRLGLSPAVNSLAGGTNYSYGGARVDSATGVSSGILTQQGQYFADRRLAGVAPPTGDPNALYIAWAGGNDMRDLAGSANPTAALENSLNALTGVLSNLIGSGAGKLLVPNLPDLGKIPEFAGTANSASATAVTNAWNAGLLDRMTALALNSAADIYFLDVFGIFNAIIDNPGLLGFTNSTDQCRSVTTLFGLAIGERECANPSSYVFWDEIHPTTAAHQVLAEASLQLLMQGSPLGTVTQASQFSVLSTLALAPQAAIPSPGSIFLLLLGMLMLAWHRDGKLRVVKVLSA